MALQWPRTQRYQVLTQLEDVSNNDNLFENKKHDRIPQLLRCMISFAAGIAFTALLFVIFHARNVNTSTAEDSTSSNTIAHEVAIELLQSPAPPSMGPS